MSVSVCDWYRRTIVTPCLLVFPTVWNTLFPCIFRQIGTPCFPAFSGRLKDHVSFHFPSGSNTLFPWIFRQIETLCFLVFSTVWNTLFPCIFSRLRHLVSLHFPADWNTLFPFIFHQVQTHCLLEYFGRLKHFVYLYFPADSNTLFPCISGGFKHLLSFYFWQIETSCKHCHCQGQVKTWGRVSVGT